VLIEPVQPVFVVMQIGKEKYACQLISLSKNKLELKCTDYFEKKCEVQFFAKHFKGLAIIEEVQFASFHFTYQLNIKQIQFQPGLLINARL